MTPAELCEVVAVELGALEATVQELVELHADVANRDVTVREQTAAAAFLAQFYNGVENILKRLSHYHDVPLPMGETWHVDLFRRFCSPSHPPLPALFDASLEATLAPYRRFRHVAFHSYGFQLEWSRMAEGVANIDNVFAQFKVKLADYLRMMELKTRSGGQCQIGNLVLCFPFTPHPALSRCLRPEARLNTCWIDSFKTLSEPWSSTHDFARVTAV